MIIKKFVVRGPNAVFFSNNILCFTEKDIVNIVAWILVYGWLYLGLLHFCRNKIFEVGAFFYTFFVQRSHTEQVKFFYIIKARTYGKKIACRPADHPGFFPLLAFQLLGFLCLS